MHRRQNRTVLLRDALANARDDSGASDEYVQGVLVGIVAALMAEGWEFTAAFQCVRDNLPQHTRGLNIFPASWRQLC